MELNLWPEFGQIILKVQKIQKIEPTNFAGKLFESA